LSLFLALELLRDFTGIFGGFRAAKKTGEKITQKVREA
jgi:hypothetical protein